MAIYSTENSCFFERKRHTAPMTMPHAHYHDTHELYFLEKGRTKYFVGNEIFMLEPGDMVFVPKFVFHKTDNGQNVNVERLRFAFDDDFVNKDCQKYINELKQKRFIRLPADKLHTLKAIITLLETENLKKEDGYTEMHRLCFMQMLILISRYCTANNTLLTESEQFAQDIATYICENCGQDLRLETLAKKYALSRSYLSRFFKANVGISIGEYITISRITAAERMLRNTNKTITQIATECGFNDSNYFAAVFKKFKGINPKKYALLQKSTKSSM